MFPAVAGGLSTPGLAGKSPVHHLLKQPEPHCLHHLHTKTPNSRWTQLPISFVPTTMLLNCQRAWTTGHVSDTVNSVTSFKAAIHFYYVLFRYAVLRLLSSLLACSHLANDRVFYLTEKIEAVTQLPSPPLIPSYPRTCLLCSEFHLSRLLGILHYSLQGNRILWREKI